MAYQFDFSPVLDNTGLLLHGALFTLELTAIGALLGVGLGIVGALVRAWNIRPFSAIFGVYVELIRNTPFLVQLFFIFFGLPSSACRFPSGRRPCWRWWSTSARTDRNHPRRHPGDSAWTTGSRSGAGDEPFRSVSPCGLLPALGKVWPALSSQIIIVMLGSAVCSQIATEELSFAANFIQSRNFRAFETYALTTLLYLCMALLIRQLLNWFGQRFIARNNQ